MIAIRARVPALALAFAALALHASAAAAALPEAAWVSEYAAALDALAAAPESAAAFEAADANWSRLAAPAAALAPSAAELLAGYHSAMTEEAEAGNASNLRDLARAAARTARADVAPAVDEWLRLGTHVALGDGVAVRDGAVRVPVVLVNPPSGGVGAFDVRVTFDGAAVEAASVDVGQGEAVVEAASARLAAFDARALAGVGSGGAPVVLGHVTVRVDDAGGARAVITVTELADREGARVPALGAPATVAAEAASPASWVARAAAPVAVAALAVGAIVAARRFVKL